MQKEMKEKNSGGQAPLVSIIVPVYKAEDYLRECVDSILAQTYEKIELLLVDDGSPDGSGAICDEYATCDKRVRVLHQPNGGVSTARNNGIEKAGGEYILFVDSDDLIGAEMVETMVNAMLRYRVDLVMSGFERFKPGWCRASRLSPYSMTILQSRRELAEVYTRPNTNMFGVSIWAKLYRADIIREQNLRFDKAISYEEDCVFNLGYFRQIDSAAVVPQLFYRYRQQQMSLSKGFRKDGFAFLVNGYRERIRFLNELEINTAGAENIFFLVMKNNLLKVYESDLSRKEKLQEYERIMAWEDCRTVAKNALRSPNRLSRMLAKVTMKGSGAQVHFWLTAWKMLGRVKAVPRKAKRTVKKLLGR